MIIGLVGPVGQDIQSVTELLSEEKDFQVVDSIQMLRLADRKLMGSLTTQSYHKKYVLKKFEQEFGTVLVTGNLVLSEDICEWILQEGGTIVVVSRDKLESYDKEVLEAIGTYWEEVHTQKYNLEVRFKKVFERLSKIGNAANLHLIDLSDEDTTALETLMELSQNWEESKEIENSYENLIELITIRKEDNTMTMEESIKKAMRELGMDVDDTPTPEVSTKKTIEPKKHEKVVKTDKPEPKKDIMNPPVENTVEGNTEEAEESAIFVKITDTTMALLIPAGMTLEHQNIGGVEFNVATVSIPDWNSRKLQELPLAIPQEKQQKTSEPVKVERKSVKVEKPEKKVEKPVKVVVEFDDLSELQAEKSRLDAEIKKYRAVGDIDTVNELRKQRRAVRNKINKLK